MVMKKSRILLSGILVICILIIAMVSFHSVQEIHYLKSFYPDHFSVSEAAYAAVVELIKVLLIALPLVLIIFVCLLLLRLLSQSGQDHLLK